MNKSLILLQQKLIREQRFQENKEQNITSIFIKPSTMACNVTPFTPIYCSIFYYVFYSRQKSKNLYLNKITKEIVISFIGRND